MCYDHKMRKREPYSPKKLAKMGERVALTQEQRQKLNLCTCFRRDSFAWYSLRLT